MLADVELGFEVADMADEVDHTQAAGLQCIGMRAHDVFEPIGTGVLERADREELVVLAWYLAHVAFDDLQLVAQASPRDLRLLHRGRLGMTFVDWL